MRLFIAEKPSLARAIAEALPGPQRRAKDHIACADDNVVAWCAGHILETAPPEAYGDFKAWRLEHLPIAPTTWKLEVSSRELLTSIKSLLKQAKRVVHAGDPDREGQLLVDEVLDFLGYRGPVDRILVRDLSPDAVRRQLGALESNSKYRPLYESALARQRADWLYGMNMTRLYTLLGRAAGYDGVLSVGRVQTPLLGLIVARDLAIEQFRPAPYYVLSAQIQTPSGERFRAHWTPGPGLEEHLDDEKRALRKDVVEAVRTRVQGHAGAVASRTEDKKGEAPPLPYSLADLQMDAARRLGMSAQAALDACQSLYERHRLTTYPRSDCSYLPEGHFAQAEEVLSAVVKHAPILAPAAQMVDQRLRSKAWNDKKVTAHHAIIPTPSNAAPVLDLADPDRAIYELIARRYVAQFYPAHEYLQTKIEVEIAGEHFVTLGRRVVAVGWKELFSSPEKDTDDKSEPASDDATTLPNVASGDVVTAAEVAVAEKFTEPPKAFNDASLMAAMCGVAKFVQNPNIKKILTEADGIGTPATRAAIIETLFDRGYVTRVKKSIVSTDTGRALIRALPEVATTPDMTAVWEAAMRSITEGNQSLDSFLARVSAQLAELVTQGKALGRIVVPAAATVTTPKRSPPSPQKKPKRPPSRRT